MQQTALLLLASACILGIYWTVQFARADLLFEGGTAETAARAVALVPDNARYLEGRSDYGSPERAGDLEKAVALNPYLSSAWMELGLIAESEGDFGAARNYLERAGRVDKTFTPRWTLANYYFRRGDAEGFWTWSRSALEMSAGDAAALYRLCWRFSDDPHEILNRVIPDASDHLVRYLLFLLAENRLEPAVAAARRLIPLGGQEHRGVLLNYCDRLVAQRMAGPALDVWNDLAHHGVIPLDPLDPAAGRSLTNGRFTPFPCSRGFDWKMVASPGVSVAGVRGGGLKVLLNGRQGEQADILVQSIPVTGPASYRLEYEFKTTGAGRDSGLHWRCRDVNQAANSYVQSPDLSGSEWGSGGVNFRTGAGARFASLALRYRRAPGTVPLNGALELRGVTLTRIDPPAAAR
ncbi:MAG: hypothetical protein KIT09_34560 [Bryobacteraceae bacterium]|nr:hypothetical protein [Bryobacteraceae bacterium]